jgi:Fe-S cluster assembly scaffold protein SufB
MATTNPLGIDLDQYKWGFRDPEKYVFKARKGLDREIVHQISHMKGEPDWMRAFRLHSLEHFMQRPMPAWGADLSQVDFDDIYYYLKPTEHKGLTWDEVPEDIKRTFDRLGIPEAERKFLAGVGAQYESESVYHNLKEEWEKLGVIFLDTDSALRQHPDLFREYFGTVVPPEDNKLAALNSAVWSGGSFVYVPEGVKVDIPLQAYFRINAEKAGQFERTLIICEPGSYVHYVEGCTAPVYTTDSLHSAVVEIIVKEGARCRYTTIQNWSKNVFNLVTKRSVAYRDATMEWVDGNLGCLTGDSKVLLNNDVKSISDVEPGDIVYSVDGELRLTRHKVVAKKHSGRQRVYRLRAVNHREIRATANHPFLTLSKRGRQLSLGWKRLDQLTPQDCVAIAGDVPDSGVAKVFEPIPIRGTKRILLPDVSTDDLMWVLGVYVGDGYTDRNRVYFAVPPRDRAHAKLVELLRTLFGVDVEVRGGVVRINSVQICGFIMSLGFVGNARQKRVPGWVCGLPKSQRLAFIEGYIAADGYRRANHTNLSITSANRDLLEDVKALAISCGLDPRKISRWSRVEKKPLSREAKEYTHYFLYFGERAYDQPVHFTRVAAVEPEGVEETWDLEIANSHNFVANGFVVHNSKITMKYPSVYMVEPGARAEILSVAFAGRGQHQDPGGKVIHAAPHTQSSVVSKSIAKDGGRAGYRGLVKVYPGARGSRCAVRCDALILDEKSRSDTYPYMEVDEEDASITHEATVSKVSDEQLFYLMSRGIKGDEAMNMIVRGFIEPIVKELPLEYAVELNRLIAMEMEGSVG